MESTERNSPARGNRTMFFFLLYLVVFSTIVSFLDFDMDNMLIESITFTLLVFVPFLFYLFFTRQKHSTVLKWKPLGKTNALLVIGLTLAAIPFLGIVNRLSALIFFPTASELVSDMAFPFWYQLFSFAVLPALFEEFLMRGALYKEFEKLPIKKVAIITGLFFGIMHLNFHQAIYAWVLGILCAYIIFYTQSIWAPILIHFVNNAFATTLDHFMPQNSWFAGLWDDLPMFFLVYGCLSLLFLPVFVVCLKKLKAAALPFPKEECNKTEESEKPKVKVFTWAFWASLAIFLIFAGILELSVRRI